ncbi:hypothetical protein ZWY2020_037852 [Hordeum vulgare]|nr:hypothetical protein ZWY2020_037852 [Hordeum vulgare]
MPSPSRLGVASLSVGRWPGIELGTTTRHAGRKDRVEKGSEIAEPLRTELRPLGRTTTAPVQACDVSMLLDSTDGSPAEKDAMPNQSPRGMDVVARVKDKLEKVCPTTVSCAEILALMSRDAVVLVLHHNYSASCFITYCTTNLSFCI